MALGANNGKVATDLLDTAFIRGQVNQGSFINDVTPLGTGQGIYIYCIEDSVPKITISFTYFSVTNYV